MEAVAEPPSGIPKETPGKARKFLCNSTLGDKMRYLTFLYCRPGKSHLLIIRTLPAPYAALKVWQAGSNYEKSIMKKKKKAIRMAILFC